MGKHCKTTGTETKETAKNYGNERLGKYFSVPIFFGKSERSATAKSFPTFQVFLTKAF